LPRTSVDPAHDGPARPAPNGLALSVVATPGFGDYALIDSGEGRKLERFGEVLVDRPEPQALWRKRLEPAQWARAHAVFSASGEDDEKGRWRVDRAVPEAWPVAIPLARAGGTVVSVTMLCRLSAMWHLGLFPEQHPHWQWMGERLDAHVGEAPRVLNLFGYTGAASLLAAAAGAQVTHVDASRKAVTWARENQAASRLEHAPMRWIVDDAQKFTAREVRRGRTYNVILVDPPKFGRGPQGETWDLFTHLPGLLADCAKLLDPAGASLVLTAYAIRASSIACDQLVRETLADHGGRYESGELAIRESDGDRLVPTSLFVRWRSDRAGA